MVTNTSQLPPAATLQRTSELPKSEETYQYEQPIGPQKREVDPNQYSTEAGPTRENYDAEERKRQRRQEFAAERVNQRVRREREQDAERKKHIEGLADWAMGEVKKEREEADAKKKRDFEAEQDEWNLREKQKAASEKYEAEQEEIVKARQKKEITPKTIVEKVKQKLSAKNGKAVQPKEDLSDDFTRKKELKRMEYEHQERMAQLKQDQKPQSKRMSKGQFHAPSYGNYIDPFTKGGGGGRGGTFPNVDPFGGMGGSGRNMMNFGFGPMNKPQQKQQMPPPRPVPVRKPKDINAAFGNPFTGLTAGAPRKAEPGKTPNILKGFGKPTKTAKKRSWMDF